MGPKEMGPWFVGKITLRRNLGMFMTEKLPFDPPAADQHSTIPGANQTSRSRKNFFALNPL